MSERKMGPLGLLRSVIPNEVSHLTPQPRQRSQPIQTLRFAQGDSANGCFNSPPCPY